MNKDGHIRVIEASGCGTFTASIDLIRATMSREGSNRTSRTVGISEGKLKALRTCAERAHRLGNHTVEDQFPLGQTSFEITLFGTTVTVTYHTASANRYDRVAEIWALARATDEYLDSMM